MASSFFFLFFSFSPIYSSFLLCRLVELTDDSKTALITEFVKGKKLLVAGSVADCSSGLTL